MRRIWSLFMRDLRVNTREFLTLYIMVVPILFGIVINLIAPGINDTTVSLALVEGESPEMVTYMEDFAKVHTFQDLAEVEDRVLKRDDVFGIVMENGTYTVLKQGNEMEGLDDFASMLLVFYEEDVQIEDSNAILHDFGRTEPPLKKLLVIIMMLFTVILGGMLISMNIIEEKNDRTVRAIHLTPMSRIGFIMGKSLMGILLPVYGSVAILLITGFTDINWAQMAVIILSSCIITVLVGFIQGINNETVMDAAGSVKMLFLPMGGAVAAIELLSDKWQPFFYWIPFYWSYKGASSILTYQAQWGSILIYTGIILAISAVVFALLMPKIHKGLE